MNIDRTCHVCNEDASYYCKMCLLHFCSEHLCLHLNVAWENNSWTKRNQEAGDKYDHRDVGSIQASCVENEFQKSNLLSDNAKSLPSYSEEELQQQLNFYMYQARRIKHELARRALFDPSALLLKPNSYGPRQKRLRVQGRTKSISNAVDILLSELRAGNLSAADISTKLHNAVTVKAQIIAHK